MEAGINLKEKRQLFQIHLTEVRTIIRTLQFQKIITIDVARELTSALYCLDINQPTQDDILENFVDICKTSSYSEEGDQTVQFGPYFVKVTKERFNGL